MNSVNKTLTLTLVVLLLSSLLVLIITPTNVQAASKPSIPQQFSIKLIDNSYDVPPVQTIDPYTGVATTIPGYRVENKTIAVTIKNQQFTSYTNADGKKCELYYRIEVKGHFSEDWRHFGYFNGDRFVSYVKQSDLQYTVMSSLANYGAGSQLDFRVKAFTGYWDEPTQVDHLIGFHNSYVVEDVASDWSKTQMFTIPGESSLPSPLQTSPPTNPAATSGNNQPQQPDQTHPPSFVFPTFFLLWIGTLLFVGVVVAVVLVFLRRHLKTSIDLLRN